MAGWVGRGGLGPPARQGGTTPNSRVDAQVNLVRLRMAGLGSFDQKSALAVAMPIATAFKLCVGHRKMGS
jgi:hypothetical protein